MTENDGMIGDLADYLLQDHIELLAENEQLKRALDTLPFPNAFFNVSDDLLKQVYVELFPKHLIVDERFIRFFRAVEDKLKG